MATGSNGYPGRIDSRRGADRGRRMALGGVDALRIVSRYVRRGRSFGAAHGASHSFGGTVSWIGRGCETPDRGTALGSFGYFGQLRKQHSVSAVTSRFCVVDESFLRSATLGRHSKTLGAWLGASAKRARRRVVYSPFLHGWTDEDWEDVVSDEEMRDFVLGNRDLLPEEGMLSPHLGLIAPDGSLPVTPNRRRRHVQRLVT